MGGCCAKAKLVSGGKTLSADTKQILDSDSSYCVLGSGVEAMEMMNGKASTYDYTKYIFENDPMVMATYSSAMPGQPKSFDEFNNWVA